MAQTHLPHPSPTTPPRVRLLDPHTINQIAAGEVVERPASAVKELVENALDAQAARVEIRLVEAGRRLIQVADDGLGMTLPDAESALLRHATSKISRVEDLFAVGTFGFRGEALPSIASVSRLTLSTGTGDGLRWLLFVETGDRHPADSVAGSRGTTVRVEDLFLNVPARLKFLKTDATELAACAEVVEKFALARPDVAFTLLHAPTPEAPESTLVRTSGSRDPLTALAEIWGRDVARALVPVDFYDGAARVRGFVSPPHFTKPNRALQWFFVNGRAIRSKTLTAAVDTAYRSLTPERRYPVVFLQLDIDPSRLDVNVSPTKSEVKFHQDSAVFDSVRRAVKQTLLQEGMVPSLAEVDTATSALREAYGLHQLPLPSHTPTSPTPHLETLPTPPQSEAPRRRYEELLDGLRVLGQVDDTFIIAENRTNLLVIDQHVAHERILYEWLVRTRGAGAVETQNLLTPETLHVGRAAADVLAERLPDLAAIGFHLEPFGGDAFLVRAVPALGRGRAPLQVLQDLADQIAEGGAQGCLTPTRDDVYIMCSCKMAVKAGDRLALPEMDKLVRDLAETENPYLCPHGRPITLVLPKSDLLRRFKR